MTPPRAEVGQDFDTIIVGAGSAGCVLANLLSRDPKHRVLLLEAGGNNTSPLVGMPRGFGKLMLDPKHVWEFETAPTGTRTEPRRLISGLGLGGSSAVNGMVWYRPQPEDFDDWAALGATGWGWDQMARSFESLEDQELGSGDARGVGGPVHISLHPDRQPLCEAFIEAGETIGIPRRQQFNNRGEVGVGYLQRNIKAGRRQGSVETHLKPAVGRANLTVETGVLVERVGFDGVHAQAVFAHRGGVQTQYNARRIILSAGALHSPKLLQLSGIGPAALLQRHGLPVLVDSPGVGRNFRDQLGLALHWRVHAHSQNQEMSGWRLMKNLLRAQFFRRGPLTYAAFEAGGSVMTRPGLDRSDAYLHMGPMSVDISKTLAVEKLPGMMIGGIPSRPLSQGSVEIASANPYDKAIIQPNFLSHPDDQAVAIGIYRLMEKLADTAALSAHISERVHPRFTDGNDDDVLEAYLRYGEHGLHPIGTCRMGTDDEAVLSPTLQVRGVQGLYVVDASVMPSFVSGNTNATVMAIANRMGQQLAAS